MPWGRKEPVIIRSLDHMQELSEASELSQRAVYADASPNTLLKCAWHLHMVDIWFRTYHEPY